MRERWTAEIGATFAWASPWRMDDLRPDELRDMERFVVESRREEEAI